MTEYSEAPITYEQVEKWIEAAVLAEREACAKVCDEYAAGDSNSEYDTGYIDAATSCAAAIRARGGND